MTTRHSSINPGAAVLWAAAFIVAALILVQAGRLPGSAAYAEMNTRAGDYTLMTAKSGRGSDADPDDLLYVLDSRDQVLLVYEIENAQSRRMFLIDGGSIDALFRNARQ
jgi:hypothetical protein